MSLRLQVLIPPDLDARIRKAAERRQLSRGEWVRRAIVAALRQKPGPGGGPRDPVARLAALDAPTADVDQMLREIEAGRG